ncbi:PREDICTED: BSD domain-containing protein 1 [Fragaria vesca subsp. vesca]|uniref:BSD domain-containing protein 1 n=1 Tax=Fragaria vesca subsp. vesca TaxID=101020 RepID=UPI0002C32FBF|nr:PREDICTED: BSD domain-containing protein 1 [Fragaria vesca subsp. vesca]
MDFFKSVFSDDPDPSDDDSTSLSQTEDVASPDPEQTPDSNSHTTGAWSFGGLMTTLATKSESVLQTYRRDLAELGSGLKKETAVIRDVASRAVKELPASLDVGASVAQVSLESVGQAIDDIGSTVWKSTAEIISHGREAIKIDDVESDNNNSNSENNDRRLSSSGSGLRKYSRFEAQVRAIQSSVSTYLEEPEDSESYREWKLGFVMEAKAEEIANLMRENGVIGEIHEEIVPGKVDDGSFWSRYFYRVYKLKEVEDARDKLVKRAISGEEEDLSWDFDDDVEEEEEEKKVSGPSGSVELEKGEHSGVVVRESDDAAGVEIVPRQSVSSDKSEVKSDSCKESDISIISSQPSMPGEEDLGWDEIEDIGSSDEKKGEGVGSTSRVDLHKRLSAAEEEEDLSWDIEDDDEDGVTKS